MENWQQHGDCLRIQDRSYIFLDQMLRLQLGILSILILSLFSLNTDASPPYVYLVNSEWTVQIVPKTLAVQAKPTSTEVEVPISLGQTGFDNINEFIQNDKIATWKIPDRFLTVRFELTADSLSVEFAQDIQFNETLNLTWPLIENFQSLQGYILPLFEGCYVPKDDSRWQNFLINHGPLNTTADLSMPFFGLAIKDQTLTYILTNPFNNQIHFKTTSTSGLGMHVSHAFTPNWKKGRYGFHISLGDASPVTPAKLYRRYLIENDEFISFTDKIKKTPEAKKLLGAAHVYLWGGKLLSQYDVTDWNRFARKLISENKVARQIWSGFNTETKKAVQEISQSEYPSRYVRRVVSRALSEQLEDRRFYNPANWTDISFVPELAILVNKDVSTLTYSELYRRNCLLLFAAFPMLFHHPDEWGDGLSVKLLQKFVENSLDRLWLGVDSWQDGYRHPTAVAKGIELGYLIGPYDSYHSIHHPNEKDTWETAQFDLKLYESGAIVNADGTKSRGFKKKGYHLSPLVAQPYVENRVNNILTQMSTNFNSWFIDCDAFGQLFDDYSQLHPATQLDDMHARLTRMSWIRDTHNMVVGSEGGSAYAASILHFAHGMTVPVIGWGDRDMKDKSSQYYTGGYWPPEGPAIHIKQVPLKAKYLYHYFDPRFRLPLYQIVFHDSVITTNHWGSGSLKFKNAIDTLALLELLYNVPPLYHLNIEEFSKHQDWISRHYAFFSPLHRQIGGQQMTDFEWLNSDKHIQRTEFGEVIEMLANFGYKT
ncbi:hypothetical protein C6497_06655 [Candidatus Poribacteria bacterium]|nr:MAG: hypothetical protein C6497_06655 [Candidatus Poribacteria bacterium]